MNSVKIGAYLLILMSLFSGWMGADVYKEERTGIEFPDAVGGYKRGKVRPYEVEAGKGGVAIGYRSEDAEVTIYIRALGKDAGKGAPDFLEESLAAIKTPEAQGEYSNVKIYEFSAEKELPGNQERLPRVRTSALLCHSFTARLFPGIW